MTRVFQTSGGRTTVRETISTASSSRDRVARPVCRPRISRSVRGEGGGIVRRIVGLVVTLASVSVAAVAGAATSEVVLNDPGVKERSPSVSDGYLVWSADKQAGPHLHHLHSYVMTDGGSPVRIDPAGTR